MPTSLIQEHHKHRLPTNLNYLNYVKEWWKRLKNFKFLQYFLAFIERSIMRDICMDVYALGPTWHNGAWMSLIINLFLYHIRVACLTYYAIRIYVRRHEVTKEITLTRCILLSYLIYIRFSYSTYRTSATRAHIL